MSCEGWAGDFAIGQEKEDVVPMGDDGWLVKNRLVVYKTLTITVNMIATTMTMTMVMTTITYINNIKI